MVKKGKSSSVRMRRQERRKKERQMVFLVATGAVLIVVAIIIAVSVFQQNQPVGEIVSITPVDRPTANGSAMGNPDAPVRIDVFEDFQCPACQLFTENVESQIMSEFVATGQVYYVFRHYPFLDDRSASKESDQSANASLCAAEQDRFWDYHDILFANWDGENQGAFADRRLTAFAEEIGLDAGQFNDCFKESRYQSSIDDDIREALRLQITGTPSVFVNGKAVRPGFVPSFDDIKAAVETNLSGSGN